MDAVVLRSADAERILAHAREAAPDEACGVLLGRIEPARVVATRVLRARNADASPRSRFEVAPEDLVGAVTAAEREGLDVVGFYHSHPRGPSGPSAVDAARGCWPGVAYVVAWLGPREGLGAWTWREDARAFAPLRVDAQ